MVPHDRAALGECQGATEAAAPSLQVCRTRFSLRERQHHRRWVHCPIASKYEIGRFTRMYIQQCRRLLTACGWQVLSTQTGPAVVPAPIAFSEYSTAGRLGVSTPIATV